MPYFLSKVNGIRSKGANEIFHTRNRARSRLATVRKYRAQVTRLVLFIIRHPLRARGQTGSSRRYPPLPASVTQMGRVLLDVLRDYGKLVSWAGTHLMSPEAMRARYMLVLPVPPQTARGTKNHPKSLGTHPTV